MKWQRPKKPTYTTGRIVIHSDDGRLWDYTHYFKIIQKAVAKYNQFKPKSAGILCPGINTGYMDVGWHETVDLPMMSWEMVEEIATKGGEILSHGKYHLFLGGASITQHLNVGDTRINYSMSEGRPREGFMFYITDGTNRDDFTVLSYNHIGTGENNYMDLTSPLTHDYGTDAKIYLHEDMMSEQLGGVILDLESRGIECKHHINAWYLHSDVARTYLEQYFESVIFTGYDKTTTENPVTCDLYALKRTQDRKSTRL